VTAKPSGIIFLTAHGCEVSLTPHAVEQMLARNISVAELERCLSTPEQSYGGSNYGEMRTTFQRGDIAVAVADQRGVVVTVLYREDGPWRSTDGRPSGRALSKGQRRRLKAMLP
jgi:hypothetical protein